MWKDPIVEEIRKASAKLVEELGNDVDRYGDHFMRLQERHRDRFSDRVPLEPHIPTDDEKEQTAA